MKRFILAVVLALLAFPLSSCGTPEQSDAARSGEAVADSDQKREEAEDVKAYLESAPAAYPLIMWEELGEVLDALGAGDSDTVASLRDSISEKADVVINYEDVPAAAESVHNLALLSASEMRAAAGNMYLASIDASDASEYISSASDSISAAGDYFDEMADEIDSLSEEYGIEVSNPFIASSDGDDAEESDVTQDVDLIGPGTYRVGVDIEPGEYRVSANAGEMGYLDVTNSSAPGSEIVAQDVFETSTYVTVSEGQYLTLMRCTASLVQ